MRDKKNKFLRSKALLFWAKKILLFFCLITVFSGATYALYTVATGYRINHSVSSQITAHGVCSNVANASGNAIFIPTKSATEWSTFRSKKPSGVSLGSCGCPVDYYMSGANCVAVGIGYYSPNNNASRYSCTNKPSSASYISDGNGSNNCSWNLSRSLAYSGSGGSNWNHYVTVSGTNRYGTLSVYVYTSRYSSSISPSSVGRSYTSTYSYGTNRSYIFSSGYDKTNPSRKYTEYVNISRPTYTSIRIGHTAIWSSGGSGSKTHGTISF